MSSISAFDLGCINRVISGHHELQFVVNTSVASALRNYESILAQLGMLAPRITSLRFLECSSPEKDFEDIVSFISRLEDDCDLVLSSFEINFNSPSRDCFKVFFDLVDFYRNCTQINLIPNDCWNPIDLLINGVIPVEREFQEHIHGLSYGIGEQFTYVNSIFLTPEMLKSMMFFINSFYIGNNLFEQVYLPDSLPDSINVIRYVG